MKHYTPCDKHDLIGCVTCTWKRPLGQQSVQITDVPMLPDLPAGVVRRLPCAWCKEEFDSWTGIVRSRGLYLHLFCLTDRGEPTFHTYDNASTQHSHFDTDRYEPSPFPTIADRDWVREEE